MQNLRHPVHGHINGAGQLRRADAEFGQFVGQNFAWMNGGTGHLHPHLDIFDPAGRRGNDSAVLAQAFQVKCDGVAHMDLI